MASEAEFNKKALQYLGGHLRNVPRLLTGQNPEPVQPWFGSGGQLESMAQSAPSPPQPTAASPPSTGLRTLGGSVSANENVQPGSMAQTAAAPVPPTPFRTTLRGGMVYEGGDNGQRTFTMGTPGQDGYGKVVALGRTGPATGVPQQAPASPSGLYVSGDPEAVARFNAPMRPTIYRSTVGTEGGPSTIDMSHQAWLQHSGAAPQGGGLRPPTYLSATEGAAMGLGWKGRLAKYREDMGAYNAATGQQAAFDIAQMREAGAGNIALLQADTANKQLAAGQGLRDAQTAEANTKAQSGLRLQAAADAVSKATPGSDEYNAALQNYLVLSGQGAALAKENKPDIRMMEEKDAFGNTISQRPIIVGRQGYAELPNVTPGAGQRQAFESTMTATPDRAKKFNALSKEQRDTLYQEYLKNQ